MRSRRPRRAMPRTGQTLSPTRATRSVRLSALLSGRREAELSALGVISGFHEPDGIVADLGGGSLELIDIKGTKVGKGITLPLGGLSLMDASNHSLRNAAQHRPGGAGGRQAARQACAAARSMPSAEPGARSPNCICASAIIC